MEPCTIALFGEAERGEFKTAYFCRSLEDLAVYLGEAPKDSQGIFFGVQALLYRCQLIFVRVQEEGYSHDDYRLGLRLLQNRDFIPRLSAIALPGVGDPNIIDASMPVCDIYKSLLITTEKDLYDYLTSRGL